MKKTIFLVLFLSITTFSQEKLSFEFDYARFNIDSTNSYLEIYYSLGQRNLEQYEDENKQYIGAYLDVKITEKSNNNVIVNKRYKSRTEINLSDSLFSSKNLIGKLDYVLTQGDYSLIISATDIADSTNIVSYNENLIIKNANPNKILFSDIQLATRIISNSQNKESMFYKNTMEIIPNPQIIYTEKMPVLFFYSEIYNLKVKDGVNLTLIQQLSSSTGRVLEAKHKPIPTQNNSIVEAGVVNLKKYPSGAYILTLSIFEDSAAVGISTSKRFFLLNPSVKQGVTNLSSDKLAVQSSEYGILSEEECDELFLVSAPIALKNDFSTYNQLTNLDGKRIFLFDFWLARDQEPETKENEFKEEYMERVEFVERRFKTFVNRGINTDRGKTYLQYGEPDEMDNYPNEHNMKPYEIWTYNSIEGGVIFVFGDVSGYGNYELLHSTKRGEIFDEYWQRRIVVN